MWVSFIKKQHFEKKLRKLHFCQRIHPDRIQNDDQKQNIDGVNRGHQHPLCLHSPIQHLQHSAVWICFLMLMITLFYICICLSMLSGISASFSYSELFQKMPNNSAPYCITVKTRKARHVHQWRGKS